MDTEIVQLARNYKEALKALSKAKKALIVAMDKDEKEARSFRTKGMPKAKKAAPAKAKRAATARAKKGPPAIPKKAAAKAKKAAPTKAKKAAPTKAKKAAPAKAKKAAPAKANAKKKSGTNWVPFRSTLLRKMKKGQWITGFDARVFSGHESGPGFTQNVLSHLLAKGNLKKRKVKNTTQWSLK